MKAGVELIGKTVRLKDDDEGYVGTVVGKWEGSQAYSVFKDHYWVEWPAQLPPVGVPFRALHAARDLEVVDSTGTPLVQ